MKQVPVEELQLFPVVGKLSPKPKPNAANKGGFPVPFSSYPELESGPGSDNGPEMVPAVPAGRWQMVVAVGSSTGSGGLCSFSETRPMGLSVDIGGEQGCIQPRHGSSPPALP